MSKLSFTVSPARNACAPSSHAELLGHAPLLRRENRIVSHQASVSIRLQEMTVTFSATGSPSLPSSSMLLQRQWL